MKTTSSDAVHWDENERSPAALVAGFTAGSLQIVWTSWISFFSGSGNFNTANRISSKHDIFSSFNITSKILSCPGSAPVYQHLRCMMLQETWTLPYSRQHSSFNQEGLHLGVGAEAFLIKALIDSTDDKIKSLTTDPSKLMLGSLIGGSLVHQRQPLVWLIFVSVPFVRFVRRCPLTQSP